MAVLGWHAFLAAGGGRFSSFAFSFRFGLTALAFLIFYYSHTLHCFAYLHGYLGILLPLFELG